MTDLLQELKELRDEMAAPPDPDKWLIFKSHMRDELDALIQRAEAEQAQSEARLLEIMQDEWNDWIMDTGTIPADFQIHGTHTTQVSFRAGAWAHLIARRILTQGAAPETEAEQPSQNYTPDMAGSGQFGICVCCGKGPTAEGHDGCLGTLAEDIAMNACCGHGNSDQAYIQYWNGESVRGDRALEVIKIMKEGDVEESRQPSQQAAVDALEALEEASSDADGVNPRWVERKAEKIRAALQRPQEKAPTDSGIPELDGLCERYNNGEIDLCALVNHAWNKALAEPSPVERPRVSDGWKLAPVNVSDQMYFAVDAIYNALERDEVEKIWRAMLAAAPDQQEAGSDE